MHILKGEGVCKYFGGLAAVSEVDFHVEEGEILGLIGPNGAGKTTLFNLISAALPHGAGVMHFNGEKISGRKRHQICKYGVARTFQATKIFGSMTVLENVMLGSLFGCDRKIKMNEARDEAMQLLDFVGLSAMSNIPAQELTLANQKRVELARSLATKPKLLLLDELIAGLNSTETDEAMNLVRKIHKMGITIIMIEHVMKAIMSICDRIIVLHHGEKIAEGTPNDIANHSTVIDIYLGK
jgi:branched-chain amino acid transport system ATP-binding protein